MSGKKVFRMRGAGRPARLDESLFIKWLRWLGRQDSNLGMAESKSAALPLGYTPNGQRNKLICPLGAAATIRLSDLGRNYSLWYLQCFSLAVFWGPCFPKPWHKSFATTGIGRID